MHDSVTTLRTVGNKLYTPRLCLSMAGIAAISNFIVSEAAGIFFAIQGYDLCAELFKRLYGVALNDKCGKFAF